MQQRRKGVNILKNEVQNETIGKKIKWMFKGSSKNMLLIETVVIFLLFTLLTDGMFLSSRNLNNLMMQGVVYSLMGIGITFIIISGDLDLSGGSVLGALVACAAVMQVNYKMGTVPTILITILIGLAIGAWHGFWIAYQEVPAFIVTLSSFLAFRGVTLLVGGGVSVGPMWDSFAQFGKKYLPSLFFKDASINDFSVIIMVVIMIVMTILPLRTRKKQLQLGLPTNTFGKTLAKIIGADAAILVICMILLSYRGFPYALLILAAFMAIFTYVAKGTSFGRYTYAIGGNKEATKMSGVNVKRQSLYIYILSGFCYAIAAIVYLGRVGSSTGNTGQNFEFSAITGCIVGGVSTTGGKGTVMGAVLGTMLMAGLDNGMSLMNMDATYQYIVRGMVLLVAVTIDIASQKKKS